MLHTPWMKWPCSLPHYVRNVLSDRLWARPTNGPAWAWATQTNHDQHKLGGLNFLTDESTFNFKSESQIMVISFQVFPLIILLVWYGWCNFLQNVDCIMTPHTTGELEFNCRLLTPKCLQNIQLVFYAQKSISFESVQTFLDYNQSMSCNFTVYRDPGLCSGVMKCRPLASRGSSVGCNWGPEVIFVNTSGAMAQAQRVHLSYILWVITNHHNNGIK